MEIDPKTGGIAAAIVAVVGLLGRYGWRRIVRATMRWAAEEFAIMLAAALKQQRIRDARDRKGRTPRVPEFVEPETTDIHELVELERKDRRAKRETDQEEQRERSRGERSPRPGTHHDREE